MLPQIICIDFGTSSLRAAVRETQMGTPLALQLGEAVRSSIDRASVPSACFVSKDQSVICFGEEALIRGLRGDPEALFEISPKTWMTKGDTASLSLPAGPGLRMSRRDVLVGLFAHVWSSLAVAIGESQSDLMSCDVRVAHPVWDAGRESDLQVALYEILDEAAAISGKTDRALSVESFRGLVPAQLDAQTSHDVDVIEPVAATLHVYRHAENSREACMVVDVGAGTTDMALFISVTPESRHRQRKFIQVSSPRSVFKAGDVIDTAVLDLVYSKASRLDAVEKASITRRRRTHKEELFKRGRLAIAGIEITTQQVAAHPAIVDMRAEIAAATKALLSEARVALSTYNSAAFRLEQIDVVFVGGGANIDFIHDAVIRGSKEAAAGPPLVIRALPHGQSAGLPASIERLAVSLGGTSPEILWPVTRMSEPVHQRGIR